MAEPPMPVITTRSIPCQTGQRQLVAELPGPFQLVGQPIDMPEHIFWIDCLEGFVIV